MHRGRVAASSATNTAVNLIHVIIILFLLFEIVILCGIAIMTVYGLLMQANRMHGGGGGVDDVINFSAVDERGAIEIDVEGCCARAQVGACGVDGAVSSSR